MSDPKMTTSLSCTRGSFCIHFLLILLRSHHHSHRYGYRDLSHHIKEHQNNIYCMNFVIKFTNLVLYKSKQSFLRLLDGRRATNNV